jgi:hypothetical protein
MAGSRLGSGRFLTNSRRCRTSITLIRVRSVIILATLSSPVTLLSCPLTDPPPLSVAETKILAVEEVEKVLYGLLVASLPSLGLLVDSILVQIGDG